jgi:hypothetical protein
VVDGTFDGVVVAGSTTNTMTITDPTAAWNGEYYAIVTDSTAECTTQTDPVDVEVPEVCALSITTEPESQDVVEGDDLELVVVGAGAQGLITYQWYLDGVALEDGASGSSTISGATAATLTVANITTDLMGYYTVTLIDTGFADCSVESEAAAVTVSSSSFLLSENFEGFLWTTTDELHTIQMFDLPGWTIYANAVLLSWGPNTSTPICGARSLQMSSVAFSGPSSGVYIGAVHDLYDTQTSVFLHAKIKTDSFPTEDTAVLKLSTAIATTAPADGELIVRMTSTGTLLVESGAASAETVDMLAANTVYHIWAKFNVDGTGWVKFSVADTEPVLGGDETAQYTGGSTTPVRVLSLYAENGNTINFDTIRVKTGSSVGTITC